MCMEDVRIGQSAIGEKRHFVIGTTPVQILDSNPHRFALFLPWASGVKIQVSPYAADFDTTSLVGTLYFGGLSLNLKDHGGLVTAPWFAVSDTADSVYWCAESLFYPEYFPENQKWTREPPREIPLPLNSDGLNLMR